jgi:hypothetical protein
MSHSPSTTDIAFAPAEPSRIASQFKASATITASRGVRVRETTSRGGPSCFFGGAGDGFVLKVISIAGKLTAAATSAPASVNKSGVLCEPFFAWRCHNAT